jgi:hypothetical protein
MNTYFNKVVFENYGHKNISDKNNFLKNNYLKTFNTNPIREYENNKVKND